MEKIGCIFSVLHHYTDFFDLIILDLLFKLFFTHPEHSYEIPVTKLKVGRRYMGRDKVVQQNTFLNDAVKIALWYYMFPVFY